jgi:signal transduction histidine kinase
MTVSVDSTKDLLGPADIVDAVAHRFNNLLNNILLDVAIIQQRGHPAELRPQTESIQRRGQEAALLVRKLQQFCRSMQPPLQTLDLNQAVRETLASRAGDGIELALTDSLPPVLGIGSDLRALLDTLLRSAAEAVASTCGKVTVRTLLAGSSPQLRIEDTGPAVPTNRLHELFDPFVDLPRAGADGLRLAACKAAARRLQATIGAEPRPGGGMVFSIALRTAAPCR